MGVAAEVVTAATRGERGRELDVTVLIPVLNEAPNMEPLIRKLVQDLTPLNLGYEIRVLDGGWTDGTFDEVRRMRPSTPDLRGIRFRRNFGKSAALSLGFQEARGRGAVTMGGGVQ